jgi:erythronate-4-phosphate dehydrogenase
MKIVCAQSVLRGAEVFSTLGEVVVLPDRKIRREDLLDADALVIRSKTRVDSSLLDGTRVSFVGTATAGFDHLDRTALSRAGILWTAAPGCNATSVAEYVMAALLRLSLREGRPLAGQTLGVIGVGQVGSRVAKKAVALGLRVLLNDPPRGLAEPDSADLRPLAEILPQCDVISLHVPLTDEPPFATRNLAHEGFFEQLRPGAWFFNASRGEVVKEPALWNAITSGRISRMVLDVFDREPEIDPQLVLRADLASPHIAGYSTDGKLKGTLQVYEQACRFFGRERTWNPARDETADPARELRLDPAGRSDPELLDEGIRRAYDIERDDAALRTAAEQGAERLALEFERLRKTYPDRKEFKNYRVRLTTSRPGLEASLRTLGFQILPAG